jgi:hypothetical protein
MKEKIPSLKELIKSQLINIYPKEMSSGAIEDFAKYNNYNGETGRKRCGDLVKEGFVKTRVETIVKSDGKITEVAFHQAVIEESVSFVEMPEYLEWQHGQKILL